MFFAVFLLALVVGTAPSAQDAPDRYIAAIEGAQTGRDGDLPELSLDAAMQKAGVPGLSVAIIRDFEIHWTRAYGIADVVSGALVFKGTRVPVQTLIDYLKSGETLDGEGGFTVWGKLLPAQKSLAAGALLAFLAVRPVRALLALAIAGNAAWVLASVADARTAELSPTGGLLGFERGGDLYVYDIAAGRERRLTTTGNDSIWNGVFDWVYEEEFGLTQAWKWSPDGERIAYWQTHVADVPTIQITQRVHVTRFPDHACDLMNLRRRTIRPGRYPCPFTTTGEEAMSNQEIATKLVQMCKDGTLEEAAPPAPSPRPPAGAPSAGRGARSSSPRPPS